MSKVSMAHQLYFFHIYKSEAYSGPFSNFMQLLLYMVLPCFSLPVACQVRVVRFCVSHFSSFFLSFFPSFFFSSSSRRTSTADGRCRIWVVPAGPQLWVEDQHATRRTEKMPESGTANVRNLYSPQAMMRITRSKVNCPLCVFFGFHPGIESHWTSTDMDCCGKSHHDLEKTTWRLCRAPQQTWNCLI